jgi:hypothetical protein
MSHQRRIRQPILVVGAGRSGTTMLARILKRHPEVAYIAEPRPIWMHGNAYRKDHRLTADHLTPKIALYIDSKLGNFLDSSGRPRLVDKTPSNCLRLGFIHALYPDCRIINIIRDGRGVVGSMLRMEQRKPNKGLIRERLRMTPLSEWPSYAPMFFRTVWRTNVLKRPAIFHGAQPPGWKDWLTFPRHISAALQWCAMVEISRKDGATLPAANYLELRYESVIGDPGRSVEKILRFARLSPDPTLVDWAAAHTQPDRPDMWRKTLSESEQRDIEHIQCNLLADLGYISGRDPQDV